MKKETKALIKYILYTSERPLTAREIQQILIDYKYATETPSSIEIGSFLYKRMRGSDKAWKHLKIEKLRCKHPIKKDDYNTSYYSLDK